MSLGCARHFDSSSCAAGKDLNGICHVGPPCQADGSSKHDMKIECKSIQNSVPDPIQGRLTFSSLQTHPHVSLAQNRCNPRHPCLSSSENPTWRAKALWNPTWLKLCSSNQV